MWLRDDGNWKDPATVTYEVLFKDPEGQSHDLKAVHVLRITDLPQDTSLCRNSAVKRQPPAGYSNADIGTRETIAQREGTERTARDPNLDKLMLGFGFAVVLGTLWWNLDYLRFMKFWVKPPYKRLTVIIFRVLFGLWFLSAASWFVEKLLRTSRPPRAYAEALGVGLAWCFAIWAMVNIVEWMNRKRQT